MTPILDYSTPQCQPSIHELITEDTNVAEVTPEISSIKESNDCGTFAYSTSTEVLSPFLTAAQDPSTTILDLLSYMDDPSRSNSSDNGYRDGQSTYADEVAPSTSEPEANEHAQ
uniref:Uncharacterized protein n=1 Tax=Lygus hesperus TaxID=30085 RepID=A0A0A9X4F8_LYGHE